MPSTGTDRSPDMGTIGAIVPVHGAIAPVLPLLAQVAGPGAPAAERCGEVLVVDDASPVPVDPASLPAGVRLLRRETNGGFAAAVNTGIAALGPGIRQVLVLNSDLRIPPGFARRLAEDSAAWQPAVVGCRVEDPSGRSGHAARFFPTIAQQTIEWLVPLASQRHRDVLHRAVGHDLTAERSHGIVPVDWVCGAVMLLPRQEVRSVGGLDEGYFMYAEEVDLQLRLRRHGVPSVLDADLVAVHLGGGSAIDEAHRRTWLVGARKRYARKHGHPWALRVAMSAASCANLVWNTGRRAAGRDVRPLAVLREEMRLIHRAGQELAP